MNFNPIRGTDLPDEVKAVIEPVVTRDHYDYSKYHETIGDAWLRHIANEAERKRLQGPTEPQATPFSSVGSVPPPKPRDKAESNYRRALEAALFSRDEEGIDRLGHKLSANAIAQGKLQDAALYRAIARGTVTVGDNADAPGSRSGVRLAPDPAPRPAPGPAPGCRL